MELPANRIAFNFCLADIADIFVMKSRKNNLIYYGGIV